MGSRYRDSSGCLPPPEQPTMSYPINHPHHPFSNPSAGPSIASPLHRRQPSRDQQNQDLQPNIHDSGRPDIGSGRFDDAEGVREADANSEIHQDLRGIFGTTSQQSAAPPLDFPRHSRVAAPPPIMRPHPDPPSASTSPPGQAPSAMLGTPPRDRLPSSSSTASLKGRRAPAPAALDLSPRSAKVLREAEDSRAGRYGKLGDLGVGSTGDGRRAVAESHLDRRGGRPLPPLPSQSFVAPASSGPSLPTSPSFPPSQMYPGISYRTPASQSRTYDPNQRRPSNASTNFSEAGPVSMSPSLPAVPLSAFGTGGGRLEERRGSATSALDRLVIADGDNRASPDRLSPVVPGQAAFSPTTPDQTNPSDIDRRTLIGVGELATPRWASSNIHQHLRTPNVPNHPGISPPLPSLTDAQLHAAGKGWTSGENGTGLGFGVIEGAKEESYGKERQRYHSISHQASPAPTQTTGSKNDSKTAPNSAKEDMSYMPDLIDFGSLVGDFQFDSTMEAAIAASLSMPDDTTIKSTISPPRSNIRASAPPPPRSAPAADPSLHFPPPRSAGLPPPQDAESYYHAWMGLQRAAESAPAPASPGSARSRIHARRQERVAAAAANGQPVGTPVAPPRTSSKISPPNSADSQAPSNSSRLSRTDKRTPPSSGKEAKKTPQSPISTHHDILKHFAPKNFSHLPPSPSSASINQFLRGSGSVNNFASVGSGTPPLASTNSGTSYFPPSTSTGSTGSTVKRSDSYTQRSRAMSSTSRHGWDGREAPDPETTEAMRKLDGLSSTPGKGRSRSKMSTGAASTRVPTPPGKKHTRMVSKPSISSLKDAMDSTFLTDKGESPLGNWVDVGEDVPAVPLSVRGRHSASTNLVSEKRESSSSTSFVGTPTSRDSLPTTSTTPSSTSGPAHNPVSARRASAGSDVSSVHSGEWGLSAENSQEKSGERTVPPVPPLPKDYLSLRQVPSNVVSSTSVPSTSAPFRDYEAPLGAPPSEPHAISPPTSLSSHLSQDTSSSRRPMNKKWSFSSALNLKVHTKETSVSPAASPGPLPELVHRESDGLRSPQTPWSEIERGELGSPRSGHSGQLLPHDSRSISSTTPIGTGAVPQPSKSAVQSSKRLTPSSIPFFRRASSSSVQQKMAQAPIPETPKPAAVPPAAQRTPSGSTRKSMLGMHIPSMLRSSASKRGLSAQLNGDPSNVQPPASTKEETSSRGWGTRTRGKVATPLEAFKENNQILKPKTSFEGPVAHRSSVSSNRSEATVNGERSTTLRSQKSGLPSIIGSPALKAAPSSSSLRNSESYRGIPSATPTKIPRIANRPVGPSPVLLAHGSMPPPAYPHTMSTSKSTNAFGSAHSKTMAASASVADFSRPTVNEFGMVNGSHQALTNGGQRARLLGPMSARLEPRKASVPDAPTVAKLNAGLPPSRRNLPIAPQSSAMAMTLSAQAKRSSKEMRPGVGSRRGSKDTTGSGQDDSQSGSSTPAIKPSKSLHSKLAVPPGARLPSSSSVGAPGVGLRNRSLVPDSPSVSPAEDEEAAGDAEMAAYVRRRATRKHTGSKKDDMSDVVDFPEDTEPAEPMSQRVFIGKHLSMLTDHERKEVLDFDQIYYTSSGKIKRPSQNGVIYNHGYDDERGDYLVVEGDHLCYRYEIIGILGKGSFGQVVQCRDHRTGGSVAVKIIRNKKRFHAQALVEVKILQQLVEWDPEDKHYMVKMTEHFYFRGHLCIVTELLSINLYELIKANQFAGFSTTLVRRFTTQMLASLQLMRSHRIVHCDLKPENILLKHPARSGIKVIDFGSSCLETEKVYTYIQSRFYRSPEVILGMNYAMAIDMWSLGCILAELYTGFPIFPGENEHEQLACIMEVLGQPERYIVEKASRRKLFFDATGTARPFVSAKGKRRRPGTKTLASVLKCDDELFVDFIAKCLTWDPDKRLKPQPAMRHPWILAGRRRSPLLSATPERRASVLSTSTETSVAASGGKDREKEKKGLIISPPTPLMARQNPALGVTASASRIGHSMSSSRLANPTIRNSSYLQTAPKVSHG
ncbi:dual specificity tyrosine-phosphorylation-regulated kinase 2/3/4, partial [Tremellales sp. Uapishka_1]